MTTMVMTDNTPNVFGDRWRHTSRDRAPGVEVHYVCEKTRRRPSVRPAVKRPRSSGGSGMAVRGAMTLDWGSSCVLGRRPSSLHVVGSSLRRRSLDRSVPQFSEVTTSRHSSNITAITDRRRLANDVLRPPCRPRLGRGRAARRFCYSENYSFRALRSFDIHVHGGNTSPTKCPYKLSPVLLCTFSSPRTLRWHSGLKMLI